MIYMIEDASDQKILSWEKNINKYCKDLPYKRRAFYLTPRLLLRIVLSDMKGKYVILQSHEGNLTIIDIIRLPLEYHADIVNEYLKISGDVLKLNRPLIAGGFIEGDGNNIKFYGTSKVFSNYFSGHDVNFIASYLVRKSGLFNNVEPEDDKIGKEYIDALERR